MVEVILTRLFNAFLGELWFGQRALRKSHYMIFINYNFQVWGSMVSHLKSHRSCPKCGEEFCGRSATQKWKRHVKICGNRKRVPYGEGYPTNDCYICGKSFSKPANAKRHVEICKMGKYREQCQHCDMKFKTKMGLNKHKCPVNIRIT